MSKEGIPTGRTESERGQEAWRAQELEAEGWLGQENHGLCAGLKGGPKSDATSQCLRTVGATSSGKALHRCN